MNLNDQIGADLTAAMKAKDAPRLSALRMLKAAVMNKSVEKGRDLEDSEVLQVIASLVKQRRDSIEQFTAGNRLDLAEKERAEIAVLDAYLPPAASEADIAAAVDAAVAETGASSAKDIGRVIKAAMARLAGKTVDGKKVVEGTMTFALGPRNEGPSA